MGVEIQLPGELPFQFYWGNELVEAWEKRCLKVYLGQRILLRTVFNPAVGQVLVRTGVVLNHLLMC